MPDLQSNKYISSKCNNTRGLPNLLIKIKYLLYLFQNFLTSNNGLFGVNCWPNMTQVNAKFRMHFWTFLNVPDPYILSPPQYNIRVLLHFDEIYLFDCRSCIFMFCFDIVLCLLLSSNTVKLRGKCVLI
jgi:hypothetical protein